MSEKLEEYTVAELVDDALESGTWNDYMRNRYVYEFKQGGRLIRGLTAEAICHIALENGISIIDTERDILNDGVLFKAVAVKKSEDGTEIRAEGIAYEAFIDRGKPDKFCWQKALTKACRNARKQLIPATMQVAAIETLLTLDPQVSLPTAESEPESEPETPHPDQEYKEPPELANARKSAFAVYHKRKDDLLEIGIEDGVFWGGVRENYGVESRKEMGETDWKNLRASLDLEDFAQWIRDIPVNETESDTDQEFPF